MATTTTLTTTAPLREDLEDIIYDISPTDTPFLSGISKVQATAKLHEWQTDSLTAATDANANLEGAAAPAAVASTPARKTNYCQIFTKSASVSGTFAAVNKAGIANALKFEELKKGKEIKRDIESSLLANKAKGVESGATPSYLAGVPSWIITNTSAGAGGADPTGDGTDARTNGTQRVFLESYLQTVIKSCWDNGGEPNVVMVGSFNKQKASAFTGIATKYKDANDKKIVATADIYVSDFGELQIIPNRFQRTRDALVLQMDMWAFATLPGRNMKRIEIATTGDKESSQIITEGTLVAKNPLSSGAVYDLTTS